MERVQAGIFPDAIPHCSLQERFVCRGLAKRQKIFLCEPPLNESNGVDVAVGGMVVVDGSNKLDVSADLYL
jgi:hypothetical protein